MEKLEQSNGKTINMTNSIDANGYDITSNYGSLGGSEKNKMSLEFQRDQQSFSKVEDKKTVPDRRKAAVTLRLCLAVVSAIMGSVEFGYNTGVINAPETQIKTFMNSTHYERTREPMSDVTITSLYALIVAIFAVGGMVGGLAAGWWADFFGRKFGMIINNIIGIAACVMMYLSRTAMSYEMIIVGRLLVGISSGLFTGLTPMYLSEISSPNIRGALGTLHQLGIVTGLLVSQVLGFPEILGNSNYWNILLGVGVAPCIIQMITMPFCPESPRFLLITKNREHQTRKALETLRGTSDVDCEIEEMKAESKTDMQEESLSIIGLFRRKTLRRPLFISVIMQLSQQLSGINAIFYYSFNLFKHAGLEKTTAAHATSGVGGTMVVMTIITIPLMDRIGRRTLHLLGLGGMFVFSILITLSLSLTYLAPWLKIANIVVSLLYVVFFAVGPGSIPWLIVSELFAQGPRPAAMSVSVVINWVSNFAVGYCFPYMQSGLGDFSFLPFTILLGLFFVFTAKFVPETKNRTIEEISQIWNKDSETRKQAYEQTVYTTDEYPTVVKF
ncbi:solute carrier family 2, facilitated glucose transporter member 1-like [Mercenaria mercenaria]|uniref:solute carrier family 2, facilitated glucose transporter member 1-like n=1 Tax=Mercenaria mercenaria TaxID=6596 RepID=UPI00234ED09D|nr:solute carrier family 2, facilitated glucose transporter member 1-like [Mercenaria mercenaria]XP_045193216.2 solute carrier family 2, facilitated glucose transporter member 1-like [Mercenaria mercenaria]XP_053401475.1 solute carrier family 2, facilitated glucose transporter member 1-like [Mercenaria mercenaria]